MTTSLPKPDKIDLRHRLLPIHDQGSRSTCLAFATTAAHEIRRTSPTAMAEDLAEEILYWGCKQTDQNALPGTTFTSASVALARWGQPTEEHWPYDPYRIDTNATYQPPAASIDPAVCNRTTLVRISTDTLVIKRVLVTGQAVMLGIQMSFPILFTIDGHITVPTPVEMLAEGHAMLIVGYDDIGPGQGHWIVRNSWGIGWGDAGYGYLPYQYVEQYGGEAWTIA